MRELPLCLAQNTQPDLAIFDVRLATRKLGPELGPNIRQHPNLCKPVSSQQIVAAVESALTE
jgi:hypothetical protein